jgi:hypothetical protein
MKNSYSWIIFPTVVWLGFRLYLIINWKIFQFFCNEDKWKGSRMKRLLLSEEGYSLILCTAGLRAFSLREGAHVINYQQLSVTDWRLTTGCVLPCLNIYNCIVSFPSVYYKVARSGKYCLRPSICCIRKCVYRYFVFLLGTRIPISQSF